MFIIIIRKWKQKSFHLLVFHKQYFFDIISSIKRKEKSLLLLIQGAIKKMKKKFKILFTMLTISAILINSLGTNYTNQSKPQIELGDLMIEN